MSIRMGIACILAALLVACTSTSNGNDLDSLCRTQVRLERSIVEARKAGRPKPEIEKSIDEYKQVCSKMKRFSEMEIYEATKRVSPSPERQ